jgi:HPt (histidine-containing phosphotransfer) domain-containing protein
MPFAPAIDAADGLAYCMGNDQLYSRLLNGFRSREARFADEVRAAVSAERWADAQRRTHDIKGLAGTIGARRLRAAAQNLQEAIVARKASETSTALEVVSAELAAVLIEIERFVS